MNLATHGDCVRLNTIELCTESLIQVRFIFHSCETITSDCVVNYRPTALASVITKVVESILLSRISGLLETCHNQFGFKQLLGTDTCIIYVLKEIVDKYRSLNGGLFMCFLDASNAFDRVKHSVLFYKLVQRGVHGYIVRILCYWYAHQTMCVRWGSLISSSFRVSNGI